MLTSFYEFIFMSMIKSMFAAVERMQSLQNAQHEVIRIQIRAQI